MFYERAYHANKFSCSETLLGGELQNFSPSAPSKNCSPASSVRAIATVNLNQDGRFSYNLGNLKADIA
ncbi:hypothetical protein [Nostoc sp.]|uniref:hypothetical protein n=1 Tax=Nostoc sp. TaxID=1180 RepID=UPI002FF82485